MTFYANWSQVPADVWRWPNFTPYEISCRCDHEPKCAGHGSIVIAPEALDKLQVLRKIIGKPLVINSAFRSPSHNKAIGGEPNSKHLLGIAFDISLNGHDRYRLTHAAEEVGFMGIGQYDTWLHTDARDTPARWDKRTK